MAAHTAGWVRAGGRPRGRLAGRTTRVPPCSGLASGSSASTVGPSHSTARSTGTRATSPISGDPHHRPPTWRSSASGSWSSGCWELSCFQPDYRAVYAVCLGLSVLYSVPPLRLKSVPGADWIINMLGFGTLTPYAGWAATGVPLDRAHGLVLVAFCPLFAALYPLTQIYQLEEDRGRGDRTLALLLGVRRSLVVSLAAAGAAFGLLAPPGIRAGWGPRRSLALGWRLAHARSSGECCWAPGSTGTTDERAGSPAWHVPARSAPGRLPTWRSCWPGEADPALGPRTRVPVYFGIHILSGDAHDFDGGTERRVRPYQGPDDRAGCRQTGAAREHSGIVVLGGHPAPLRPTRVDRGRRHPGCGPRRRQHAAGTLDPAADHRGDRGSGRNRSGSRWVFLLVDVALLQNIGTYSHRWYEVGGGSNWWYHPVWWMAGTFIPWMGAWILANQTVRDGQPAPLVGFLTAVGAAVVLAAAAVLLGFPGARWTLATFGVAYLPGLALATALSAMRKRHP